MRLLENEICITWSIDDVRSLEPNMSLEDCREVLALVLDTHDANIGVNWDTIKVCIDQVKDYQEIEE